MAQGSLEAVLALAEEARAGVCFSFFWGLALPGGGGGEEVIKKAGYVFLVAFCQGINWSI